VGELGPERVGLVEGGAPLLEDRDGLAELAKLGQGVVDGSVRLGLVGGKCERPIPRGIGGLPSPFWY
jgi:hypothetical protein